MTLPGYRRSNDHRSTRKKSLQKSALCTKTSAWKSCHFWARLSQGNPQVIRGRTDCSECGLERKNLSLAKSFTALWRQTVFWQPTRWLRKREAEPCQGCSQQDTRATAPSWGYSQAEGRENSVDFLTQLPHTAEEASLEMLVDTLSISFSEAAEAVAVVVGHGKLMVSDNKTV